MSNQKARPEGTPLSQSLQPSGECQNELRALIEKTLSRQRASGVSKNTIRDYERAMAKLAEHAERSKPADSALDAIERFLLDEGDLGSRHSRVMKRRAALQLRKTAASDVGEKAWLADYSGVSHPFALDIEEFAEREFRRGITSDSVKKAAVSVRHFARNLAPGGGPQELQISDIDDFLKWKAETVSYSALTSYRQHLKAFAAFLDEKYAMGGRLVLAFPARTKRPAPKVQEFLTRDELRRMIEAASRTKLEPKRTYMIITMLTQYPMRGIELRRMRLGDIDWTAGFVTVRAEKTGESKRFPLTREVRIAVADYLKNERPDSDDDHLLLSAKPPFLPLSRAQGLSEVVRRVAQEAGIAPTRLGIGSHTVRRSVATFLMSESVPYPVISEMLIHKPRGTAFCGTTMRYLRVDVDRLRRVALEVPHGQRR